MTDATKNQPTTPLESRQALAPAHGSAHPSGGPEVWNVVAWGDVRGCRTTESVIKEVREALELGCRTISVERHGAPNDQAEPRGPTTSVDSKKGSR